ncbi:vWA domain-containing protein [Nocardioides campestrisoli]|uniref:vWA domain-containing protein n=1 Tax=Nocardioides campestrisoli TaxID=2736757 RepID=UPI0015E72505|nr:VWA domain-containing protein [Nocardioides campestrisoli]
MSPLAAARHEADELLLGLVEALRAAGLMVPTDRSQAFLAAVATLGAQDPDRTRAAGRATVCAGPADLALFDLVFDAWFARPARPGLPSPPALAPSRVASVDAVPADGNDGDPAADPELHAVAATGSEVLRHRDVALLDPAQRRRLAALFEALDPAAPLRRGARRRPARRGRIDVSRTARASMRQGGEPARLLHHRPRPRRRRVVLLVDVSGSMTPYADALLRLAHRFVLRAGTDVEVFTFGTRLTRVTRALRVREPEQALARVGLAVPDWSGGTRLGESLQGFLDRWGRPGLARGAVVVVFSDGWERGDPALLGEQAARLGRLAHRTVWVNPHRGKPGYRPVQGGVVAVLPHIDDFLAGHTMATYDELVEVVRGA